MKHKLFILMTIFWLLLFSNCQTEEDYIEQGETHGSTFQVKRLTQIEFKRAVPKAFGKTEELNLQQSSHAKGVAVNDFIVETDEVIQITKGDIVSYTLSVYRDEPNDFVENLVLTQKPDGNYIARLVSYDLTDQEKELLSRGAFLDITNKMSSQLLENGNAIGTSIMGKGSSSNCFSLETHYDMCCHNVHSTLDIMNGADCTCPNPPTGYTFVISTVPCSDAGGGFGTPGDTSPVGTGPSNGDGSSSGGGTTNPNNPQNPNPQDPEDDGGSEDSFEEPTLPLIKPDKSTPCKELKKFTDLPAVKQCIGTLNSKVTDTKEWGFAFKTFPNSTVLQAPQAILSDPKSPKRLWMEGYNGGDYIGASHTHTDPLPTSAIPMFSPADIYQLAVIAIRHNNNGQPKDYSRYFLTLTVGDGTYALKIKDWNKVLATVGTPKFDEIKENLLDSYIKSGVEASQKTLQKDILKQFAVNDMGIGLYKASLDLNSWSEIILDPMNTNNDPIAIPCN